MPRRLYTTWARLRLGPWELELSRYRAHGLRGAGRAWGMPWWQTDRTSSMWRWVRVSRTWHCYWSRHDHGLLLTCTRRRVQERMDRALCPPGVTVRAGVGSGRSA